MQTSRGQCQGFRVKNGDSKLMTEHDVAVEHVQTKEWSAGFLDSNNSLEIKLNNESSRCLHLNLTKFLWKIPVDVPKLYCKGRHAIFYFGALYLGKSDEIMMYNESSKSRH